MFRAMQKALLLLFIAPIFLWANDDQQYFIDMVQTKYVTPYLEANEQAWLDSFDPSAVGLHDGLPPLQGHEALAGFFRIVHEMFEIERFDVVVDEVRKEGNWVVTRGHFDALFVAKSAQAPAGVAGPRQGKFLLLWQKNADGEWKLIYDMGNSIAPAPPAAVDLAHGEQAYYSCLSCHGADGEGNEALAASVLAGLDAAYIEKQLTDYRQGRRGHSLADLQGRQMSLVAATLADEQQVRDLAAYISSLPVVLAPPVSIEPVLEVYRSCVACHGENAMGNPALGAPALGGQLESYLEAQMKLFRDGLRGHSPDDAYGQQMAAIASSLDEQQIQALARFLSHTAPSQ